jgi:hypothetical protein
MENLADMVETLERVEAVELVTGHQPHHADDPEEDALVRLMTIEQRINSEPLIQAHNRILRQRGLPPDPLREEQDGEDAGHSALPVPMGGPSSLEPRPELPATTTTSGAPTTTAGGSSPTTASAPPAAPSASGPSGSEAPRTAAPGGATQPFPVPAPHHRYPGRAVPVTNPQVSSVIAEPSQSEPAHVIHFGEWGPDPDGEGWDRPEPAGEPDYDPTELSPLDRRLWEGFHFPEFVT